MNDRFKGYLLGAIAAASYGTNPIFAIPLYGDGMDVMSVLFFRYLIAIPIVAIMMKSRGRSFRVEASQISALLFFGLMMGASSLTLFLSYNYMGAGIASTILFVYPLLVAIIMAVGYGERAGWKTLICIAMALAGIALLYRTEDGGTLSTLGVVLVFLSALTYAVYLVGVNHSVVKNMPTLTLTFYVLVVGAVIFGGYSILGEGIHTPAHWYGWLSVLGVAVFPTAVSFLCTTSAITYIGSTPTAILGALEPLTAVVLGILFLGEAVTPRMALGMLLIIVSVTIIVAGGSLSHHLTRYRKMLPSLRKRFVGK